MDIATNTLMGIGLAADAFTVSLTSGLLIKRIKVNKALKIAIFFGAFQTIMPIIGWLLGLNFKGLMVAIAPWIAFFLLAGIGGKMTWDSLTNKEEQTPFNPLESSTLFGLAIGTSIDALAVGFSLSVLETSIIEIATLIGVITFVVCFAGVFLGHAMGNHFSEKVEIAGGLILIGIGTKILWQHLSTGL